MNGRLGRQSSAIATTRGLVNPPISPPTADAAGGRGYTVVSDLRRLENKGKPLELRFPPRTGERSTPTHYTLRRIGLRYALKPTSYLLMK